MLYEMHNQSDEEYISSARRRLQHLINIGYKKEDIKGKIPKNYYPMPVSIKEMLLDEIILPLYMKKEELIKDGLKSFGVQGMIINGKLFPIEFNRQERFVEKSYFDER